MDIITFAISISAFQTEEWRYSYINHMHFMRIKQMPSKAKCKLEYLKRKN